MNEINIGELDTQFVFSLFPVTLHIINLGYITTPQDLDQYVLSSEDGSFYCGICNQGMKKKDNLKRHIESKHFPNIFSYQCPDCSTVLGTRRALERHRENSHPKR